MVLAQASYELVILCRSKQAPKYKILTSGRVSLECIMIKRQLKSAQMYLWACQNVTGAVVHIFAWPNVRRWRGIQQGGKGWIEESFMLVFGRLLTWPALEASISSTRNSLSRNVMSKPHKNQTASWCHRQTKSAQSAIVPLHSSARSPALPTTFLPKILSRSRSFQCAQRCQRL